MDPGPIPLLSMSIYLVTSWRERWAINRAALSPLNGLLSLDYIIQLRIRGVVTSPGLCAYELYIVINCNICELDPV